MKFQKDSSLKGVITSRKCPHCGHHEIGFKAEEGQFHPLKPGMFIEVIGDPLKPSDLRGHQWDLKKGEEEEKTVSSAKGVWIPEPISGARELCLKYGIMVEKGLEDTLISKEAYEAGYLEKLTRLIENETDIPLAVILDRFFTAPHLASGEPKQTAEAVWLELEEVRRPVFLVKEWLERQDEESLRRMIHPYTLKDLEKEGIDGEPLRRALDALDLEAFLEML